MMDDYLVGLFWALVLGASILLWPISFVDKRALLNVWGVKIFTTLGVMLAYESRYEGQLDAVRYYQESAMGGFAWENFEFGEGTTNIFNFLSVYNMILPDSYHAMKVTFAMVGMIAVYIFYRAAVLFLQRDDIRVFYALALYPTILFWSSILGKDPLILLGVSFYTYGVVGWRKFGTIQYLLWGAFGLWFSAFMRLWYGPILLAPLIVFVINKNNGITKNLIFITLIVGSFVVTLTLFAERFSIANTQDILAQTNQISKNFSAGGSAQAVNTFNSPAQLLAFMPIGMFTALFRPLPGEILNPFGLIAGFENLFVLWLLVIAIKQISIKDLQEPLILWAIALIIIWAAIYAFVSSGNLGTAVRYRLSMLPILLSLLLYLYFKSSYEIKKKFQDSKLLKHKKVILKFKT
ncbi:hypothetical protein [Candidatus Marithrix sp. Canyon 246]|uniref:hypothetical protein n=1 Tax=Candidatus Marithrix sp. Canyon 246 TaxID=1827136 RepID=UPI00114CB7AD|nr:hypothetical protein [Candidatus Marithrix sp. Canyon 246]